MAEVGSNVVLKRTLMVGVVVEAAAEKDYFYVKVWNSDLKKYENVKEHQLYMETLNNPLLHQQVNMDDKKARNEMYSHLLDLALDNNDREWFEEILAAKNGHHATVEESDMEKNRVRVGQMVVDNNGQNAGVVIAAMKHRKNMFIVRCWSVKHSSYIQLERPATNLKVIHSPSWKSQANTSDQEAKDTVRNLFTELALATEDYEWLEQISKPEAQESDGA